MRTAQQWTKYRDFLGGEYDTAERMQKLIAEVQADALQYATLLLTANADSQERGFNAVYRCMLEVKKAASPN
jgi:hypothetical protein